MQPEMGCSFKAAQNLYREARSREGVGGGAARAGSGVQELSPLYSRWLREDGSGFEHSTPRSTLTTLGY